MCGCQFLRTVVVGQVFASGCHAHLSPNRFLLHCTGWERNTSRRLPRAVLPQTRSLRLTLRTSNGRCVKGGLFSQGSWLVRITSDCRSKRCLGKWREATCEEGKNGTGRVVWKATYRCSKLPTEAEHRTVVAKITPDRSPKLAR